MMRNCQIWLGLLFIALHKLAWGQTSELALPGSIVESIQKEAEKVRPLIKGEITRTWLDQAAKLPPIALFPVSFQDKELMIDESRYYLGRYGSPIAYARILDLIETQGLKLGPKSKVLDFGYGAIGQLKMLSEMEVDAFGVDVDPLLPLIYERHFGDVGVERPRLYLGRFPAEKELVDRIGDGFDLFLSKNTLKRGYVHPSRQPTNPRQLIDLGVNDEQFLAGVYRTLKPGGYLAIYNFCPAKAAADKPYVPWAEGECPFSRSQLELAGFEIIALDEIDDSAARELAHQLGWDSDGGMSLQDDLFAWYSIARKRSTENPKN